MREYTEESDADAETRLRIQKLCVPLTIRLITIRDLVEVRSLDSRERIYAHPRANRVIYSTITRSWYPEVLKLFIWSY